MEIQQQQAEPKTAIAIAPKTLVPPLIPSLQPFQLDPYGGFVQYTTYEQANQMAAFLVSMGFNMLAGTDQDNPAPTFPGVSEPSSFGIRWTAKPGPDGQIYYALVFALISSNKQLLAYGFNVGLVIRLFKQYPQNYAINSFLLDIAGQTLTVPVSEITGQYTLLTLPPQ